MESRARRAMQGLGIVQAALAVTILVAPRRGSELAGMSWERATGEALLGWRLFALRQLCLGAGGVAGLRAARDVNRFLQPADLALFVHAHRCRSVPRRVSGTGIAAAACALVCVAWDLRDG